MNTTPTAQLNVRIPRDLLDRLRSHAALAERPVSAVVLETIRERIDATPAPAGYEPAAANSGETDSGRNTDPPEQHPLPPTIPHQPDRPQRPRPARRRISVARSSSILAIMSCIGLGIWAIAQGGATIMAHWIAVLAIVDQAEATEPILVIGADGLQACVR